MKQCFEVKKCEGDHSQFPQGHRVHGQQIIAWIRSEEQVCR